MKMLRQNASLILLLIAAFSGMSARADESCHLVKARGIGQDNGSFQTTGRLLGGGVLHGTFTGSISPVGGPPLVPFVETTVFTTQHGTLTVNVTGSIDVNTGEFYASGPVIEGTERFLRSRGALTFSGVVDFATGAFTEEINGVVCLAK